MKRRIAIALNMVGHILSGCVVGTGRVVTGAIEVNGFDRVVLTGFGQLDIAQAEIA